MRRPAPDCLDPKIHHNNLLPSILAKIEANVAGADDAVMLDHRGFIAETNATHIFMVLSGDAASSYASPQDAGSCCTPTTASCPEGITRATVLRLAAGAGLAVADGDYTLPQLYNAAEAFVTGTMGGLAPWCPWTAGPSVTAPSARSPSSSPRPTRTSPRQPAPS